MKHKWFIPVLCLALLLPMSMAAQSDVGQISGTVTDKSGAVVANAKVEIRDLATNSVQTTTTGTAGQYVFPRVTPSTYKLSVTAPGFATGVLNNLSVFVGKTATANVTLQVGALSEVVEVQGGTPTELQTTDASVGAVITNADFRNAPNLGRDVTGLVLLQPGAMPVQMGDENTGGQIMGARSDQNTYTIDGADATNNTDALGSYAGRNNFGGQPHAAVPTPVESVEEFRVVTNNNMAGLGRSAGAEVQMVTRRGTNSWHGSGYEYAIQDEFNANFWQLNRVGQKKPEWRDNRFGGTLGGPIIKDKTFFFMNVESRHFLQGNTVTRWTPTQSVRNGLIGYKTCDTGCYKTIPLVSVDPLALGLNPTIKQIWDTMPLPNDTSVGDGVNFQGFTASAPLTTNSESVVGRLDHQLTSKWSLTGSYRYGVEDNSTTNQTLMTSNGYTSLSSRPVWGNFAVLGLTGQITPNFINDVHVNFLRSYWKWGDAGDQPQLPGLGGALQLRTESVTSGIVPVNVDTQQSRQRLWDGKDFNINDNISWSKGKHVIQFGGRMGWQRFLHLRNDKVTGGTTDPIYYAAWSGGTYSISGITAPADLAGSATSYRAAYVSMLGMISQATQVLTRSSDLTPNQAGTWVTGHAAVNSWELHFADSWHISPSLTLNYGLLWGVELPPYSLNGRQTVEIDAATGKSFSVGEYLGAREAAALKGQIYNPVIGFQPIRQTTRKYPFDPDYKNVGPRLALAWNPSAHSGFWGRLLGDKKTVIRAGWQRAFDRVNGVDDVMTPALGIGFADLGVCNYPTTTGACGSSANKTTPTNAFRIGVNGNKLSIPSLPSITPPVIPGFAPGANVPFSNVDWHIDPRRQVGNTDVLALSIQREMPKNMLLEVGFVGRISRNLYQKSDLNSVPYMYTMGGQTFAAAFDAVQKALIAGTSVANQPFFEAALGGTAGYYCSHNAKGVATVYASCTAAVVAKEGGNISVRDVSDTWVDMDGYWTSPGGNPAGQFLRSDETYSMDTTISGGSARYAGGYISLRKSGRNLTFSGNYTLSKSLDSVGWNQDIIDTVIDPYNLKRSYGYSLFDRRHVLNAMATWVLPFGHGQHWAAGGIADKLFGGFSTSYIFSAGTGIPNEPYSNGVCGYEFGGGIYSYSDCSSLMRTNGGSFNFSRHSNDNAFSDPNAVLNSFRLPLFSDARGAGYPGWMRGLGFWNFDASIAKTTHITEKVTTRFSVDLINAFNHPNLQDPSTDVDTPATFGVLTQQRGLPRYIQWGLRFDF